jgi:Spy/CpxP family protein refolding chaperone
MKQTLFAILMIVILGTGVFAQGRQAGPRFGGPPPIGTPQRGQAPDRTAALKAALNLTDAQVAAITTLMQTRRTRAQAIFTEIQQKRQALDALLNATPPNPTDVGNAAIALHASEMKLAGEKDWFLTELKKLLTGEQQQTLDNLLAANARTPILPLLGLGGQRGPRR